MVLAQELLEGSDKVGFDEAGEDVGGEICPVGSVGAFEGLDGLDCFSA